MLSYTEYLLRKMCSVHTVFLIKHIVVTGIQSQLGCNIEGWIHTTTVQHTKISTEVTGCGLEPQTMCRTMVKPPTHTYTHTT